VFVFDVFDVFADFAFALWQLLEQQWQQKWV
jgi:hypothetical protein